MRRNAGSNGRNYRDRAQAIADIVLEDDCWTGLIDLAANGRIAGDQVDLSTAGKRHEREDLRFEIFAPHAQKLPLPMETIPQPSPDLLLHWSDIPPQAVCVSSAAPAIRCSGSVHGKFYQRLKVAKDRFIPLRFRAITESDHQEHVKWLNVWTA